MSLERPPFSEIGPDLQRVLDPAKGKALLMVAKGVAPLPPQILVSCWVYLEGGADAALAEAAKKSLTEFPEKMMLQALQAELPAWVLYFLGLRFKDKDELLEPILLNNDSPHALFLELAPVCSEKMAVLITNNQERIIDCPEIVVALEKNPKNLKSNTERLKHFLHLAGIQIPGERAAVEDKPPEELKVEAIAADEGAEPVDEEAVDKDAEKLAAMGSALSEDEKLNLQKFIAKLNIGGRVKLAMKGNKEARQFLIRDTNTVVALAVLKSSKITENEVAHYATLRNVSDDVIRGIARNPVWTKGYAVKFALCFHPKAPIQFTMPFIKFLSLRDLAKLAKDRNVPGPLKKASKELLNLKRK